MQESEEKLGKLTKSELIKVVISQNEFVATLKVALDESKSSRRELSKVIESLREENNELDEECDRIIKANNKKFKIIKSLKKIVDIYLKS